jgi:hypothetical protein
MCIFEFLKSAENSTFYDSHHGGGGGLRKCFFAPSPVLPRIFAAAGGGHARSIKKLFFGVFARMFYIKMKLLQVARIPNKFFH